MQEKEVDMKGDGVTENSPIRGRVISLAFGFQNILSQISMCPVPSATRGHVM